MKKHMIKCPYCGGNYIEKEGKKVCEDCGKEMEIDALTVFDAFMTVVNRHRPYEPSDFIKEYFIADI